MNRKQETAALKALLAETKEQLALTILYKRQVKSRLEEIYNRLEAIRYEQEEAA